MVAFPAGAPHELLLPRSRQWQWLPTGQDLLHDPPNEYQPPPSGTHAGGMAGTGCLPARMTLSSRTSHPSVRFCAVRRCEAGAFGLRHNETHCTGAQRNGPKQTEEGIERTGAEQSGPKRTEARAPLSGPRYRGSNPCRQEQLRHRDERYWCRAEVVGGFRASFRNLLKGMAPQAGLEPYDRAFLNG